MAARDKRWRLADVTATLHQHQLVIPIHQGSQLLYMFLKYVDYIGIVTIPDADTVSSSLYRQTLD